MSQQNIIIPVSFDAIPRPRDEHIARKGPRRLVKLAPVMGGVPIIWTSPHTVEERIEEVLTPCRICVVLVQRQPAPETMRVTIPEAMLEKLQDVPVEW